MKRIFSTTCLLVLLTAFAATQAAPRKTHPGTYVKKSYTTAPFKAISASAGVEVIYSPGQRRQKIEAETSKDILPYLNIKVEKGTLVVGMKKHGARLRGKKHIVVRIANPGIDELCASSGAEIDVEGSMRSNGNLRVSASSGAEIKAEGVACRMLQTEASSGAEVKLKGISAESVRAQASSGAELSLSGNCRRSATLSASSGAEIDAERMKTYQTMADANSGASISCHAQHSLTARTSSGGTVSYRGNPTQVKRESKQGIRHKR